MDKDLGLVEASEEEEIAINADHFTICELLDIDGRPHQRVVEKARSMIEDAVNTVQERIQACQWNTLFIS